MSIRDLVDAVNASRPTAPKKIIEVATCDYCKQEFAIQPQDLRRIHAVRARLCCWDHGCRSSLRKAQNRDAKK